VDKSEVRNRVRRFAEKAGAALPVRQVILFGSYAHGSPHEFSDIDVAVIAEARVEDWLDVSAQLFGLRRDIDVAIEPVLIDSEEDRSGFLEEIRRTGEIIYDRDAERAAA
jgi:predicted nucleotidyltransferase